MNKFLIPVISCTLAFSARAQQQPIAFNTKDYERAESFMSYNTEKLIDHGSVNPNWITGDLFWYRTLTPSGSEFILINPAKKKELRHLISKNLLLHFLLQPVSNIPPTCFPFVPLYFQLI